MNIKSIGKMLFTIGLILVVLPILSGTILSIFSKFFLFLFGWLISILGAALVSLRVVAWTVFLIGLCLLFLLLMPFIKVGGHPLAGGHAFAQVFGILLVATLLHIFIGLILGIISFIRRR